jgi:hypothetical protein
MAESTEQGLSQPVVEDAASEPVELSDDQLWDQVGAPVVEDVSDEASPAATDEAEEESEVFEVEAPSEPTAEERREGHNYEKRYKDLEREFHRRNEETKELREQFQQLRLERLEMERQLAKQKEETPVEAKPREPSPLDEDWFDPATKQTLDEFQELTSAYKKLIAHEIAKATKGIQMPEIPEDRIGQLEEIAQQYKANQYRLQHAAHMRTSVGDDYMDIDKSQEFYDYVNASPIRLAAMTKSMNPEDHAAVMNDFLNTPVGREKFRSEPAPEVAAAPVAAAETQGTVRRKAAQGLLKNSNPRQQERRPEDMNDEELWESIAV